VTLSSVWAWLSVVGQAHREKAVAIRPTMAACAETAWPFEAAVSERTLFVSKAATHQAASIPACAADRALSGYCHG
jgi:hypothetical protein